MVSLQQNTPIPKRSNNLFDINIQVSVWCPGICIQTTYYTYLYYVVSSN